MLGAARGNSEADRGTLLPRLCPTHAPAPWLLLLLRTSHTVHTNTTEHTHKHTRVPKKLCWPLSYFPWYGGGIASYCKWATIRLKPATAENKVHMCELEQQLLWRMCGDEMWGTVCVYIGEWHRGEELMSALTDQNDGWFLCLQEIQMNRGSLMAPNGQNEDHVAASHCFLFLSCL